METDGNRWKQKRAFWAESCCHMRFLECVVETDFGLFRGRKRYFGVMSFPLLSGLKAEGNRFGHFVRVIWFQ